MARAPTTMTVDMLLIDAVPVPCEIRRSPRRRTLAIEVYPDLRVIVRAPARCPQADIDLHLAGRTQWIGRVLARFRRLGGERAPPPRYVSGETHLYMGAPHRLEIVPAPAAGVTRVTGALLVAVPERAGADAARRILGRWYRERADEVFAAVLAERFAEWGDTRHERPALRVRAMRTRWGSLAWSRRVPCEPARMTLNLALIHAPRECIEYVVTHELCHLEHRGHGARFHALLTRILPDWRERRRRLNALPLP
jgi:predicted metal-dependent hydrolase